MDKYKYDINSLFPKFRELLQRYVVLLELLKHTEAQLSINQNRYYTKAILFGFCNDNELTCNKSGNAHSNKDGGIQLTIMTCRYFNLFGRVYLSVQTGLHEGYATPANNFLHWSGTSKNIKARWNDKKTEILSLYICDGKSEVADWGQEIKVEDVFKDEVQYNDYIEAEEKLQSFFWCYMKLAPGYITYLLSKVHNIVLTGAPGTGKTFLAHEIATQLIKQTFDTSYNDYKNQSPTTPQIQFVQFHPSYDYTDFVEGLRPYNSENDNIGFKHVDGVFKQFCKTAALDSVNDYVFIIDEINRGEISKIFGELFFSIDDGYRGDTHRVNTQYQNLLPKEDKFADGFFVPKKAHLQNPVFSPKW